MRHVLAFVPITLCVTLATAPAQEVLRRHASGDPGAAFGLACAALGDVDEDGVADYAVGAPRGSDDSEGAGAVKVFSGRTGKVLWSLRGANPGDRFGYAIAGAGDVDGDGAVDVAVGAPFDPDRSRRQSGSVQVFSGRDAHILWTARGVSAGNSLGWSLCGLGDVDRDGHPDLAAGAPFRDVAPQRHDAGAVRILSGKAGTDLRVVLGDRASARFGWALARIADLDHDRRDDFVVGIEGHAERRAGAGRAEIRSSRTGRALASVGGRPGDYFGTAVAAVGDLDGDGREDFLVGARNATRRETPDPRGPEGAAMLFSGRRGKLLRSFSGDGARDWFGHAVAGLGDVDGDGVPDLAVGAPQRPRHGTGYVRVFSGRTGRELYTLRGEQLGEGFGMSLCAVRVVVVGSAPKEAEVATRALLVGAPWRGAGGVAVVFSLPAAKAEPAKGEGR